MVINLKRTSPCPCFVSAVDVAASWQVSLRLIGFPSIAQRCVGKQRCMVRKLAWMLTWLHI